MCDGTLRELCINKCPQTSTHWRNVLSKSDPKFLKKPATIIMIVALVLAKVLDLYIHYFSKLNKTLVLDLDLTHSLTHCLTNKATHLDWGTK